MLVQLLLIAVWIGWWGLFTNLLDSATNETRIFDGDGIFPIALAIFCAISWIALLLVGIYAIWTHVPMFVNV